MSEQIYKTRPYEIDDYDFVYNTKKVVYQKYIISNWGEWNEDKQREMFSQFINEYSKDIMIIIKDNLRIGFFHGEDIDNTAYEIGNICILPNYQGQGIGTAVLNNIIASNNNKDIYLRYFKQNPVANLYHRLGFEITKELPYHFQMILKSKK